MSFLSNTEKTALAARITHAESQTRAEIVTVIAGQSDGYRYIPILWAALIALSIPGVYFLLGSLNNNGWVSPESNSHTYIYPMQVLVFLGLGGLFQIPRCRFWIIPKSVKHQRAARHAREQFFLQGLHLTTDRSGVLIFVSVAEHYVEIIVDSGVAEVVDNKIWTTTIDDFVQHVQRGDIATGFESAIEHCRQVLWQHFPASEDNDSGSGSGSGSNPASNTASNTAKKVVHHNELPNHLIEV